MKEHIVKLVSKNYCYGGRKLSLLIKNANLISMSKNRPKIEENMDIFIEENKIKKIAQNLELIADEVIDAKRKSSYARTYKHT